MAMKPLFRPKHCKSSASTIVVSIALAAIAAAAFANNFIGVLGLLAAPFWLPLCCRHVPLYIAKIYLGVSVACLLLSIPMTLVRNSSALPNGFVFTIARGALMMTIVSSLGVLVAYSTQHRDAAD